MKYLLALLLPLALTFAACGGADSEMEEAAEELNEESYELGNDVRDAATLNDRDMNAVGMTSINETVTAVKNVGGDITALPPAAAVSNIDSWIAKLNGIDGTGEVVANLRELKMELSKGNIDGPKVGTLLNALAEDTREIAPNNMALKGLTSALSMGGQKLGGM